MKLIRLFWLVWEILVLKSRGLDTTSGVMLKTYDTIQQFKTYGYDAMFIEMQILKAVGHLYEKESIIQQVRAITRSIEEGVNRKAFIAILKKIQNTR